MKILLPLFMLAACVQVNAQELDGKVLFAKNCSACHQRGGTGIEGAFPALKGNPFVQSEATPVITTVLKGRAGMPTFASSLADEKIAAILSYVRQAWGNQAGAITPDDVAAVRLQSGAAASMDGAPRPAPSH